MAAITKTEAAFATAEVTDGTTGMTITARAVSAGIGREIAVIITAIGMTDRRRPTGKGEGLAIRA